MLSIGLGHYLTLAAIIFTIGIVGIFPVSYTHLTLPTSVTV